MKTSPVIALLTSLLLAVSSDYSYAGDSVLAVTVSSGGTAFFLDEKGYVWGFTEPDFLKGLIKLPNLANIKQIVPFAALRGDGKVLVWGMSQKTIWLTDREGNPLGRKVEYTAPEIVPGLSNVVNLAGTDFHYLALEANGDIFQWGRPLASYLPDADVSFPEPAKVPEPQKLATLKNVKSIFVGPTSAIVLTSTGVAYGWGNVVFNDCNSEKRPPQQPEIMNFGNGISQIYTTNRYVITLSIDKTARYWGGCNPSTSTGKGLYRNGWEDNVGNIQKINPSIADGSFPNIYVLTDGTILLAPDPDTQCQIRRGCRSIDDSQNKFRLKSVPGLSSNLKDMLIANTFEGERFVGVLKNGEIWAWNSSLKLP